MAGQGVYYRDRGVSLLSSTLLLEETGLAVSVMGGEEEMGPEKWGRGKGADTMTGKGERKDRLM